MTDLSVLYPSDSLYPSDTLEPSGPTTYTATTLVGQKLIDQLSWFPGDSYWLPAYFDAIGALFEETARIVTDIGVDGDPDYQTGYGSIFTVSPRFAGDTAICPTNQLPYLGQFVGVSIPADADDATARSLITSEQGMQRGSSSAIDAAAMRYLIGTLTHQSRLTPLATPNAFYFTLIVNPAEVINEAALIDAVNAVKPAWVQWSLVVASNPWSTATHTWAQDTSSWSTYASVTP